MIYNIEESEKMSKETFRSINVIFHIQNATFEVDSHMHIISLRI